MMQHADLSELEKPVVDSLKLEAIIASYMQYTYAVNHKGIATYIMSCIYNILIN